MKYRCRNLKEHCTQLESPTAHLINKSLELALEYKKQATNYRPISLTSVLIILL